MAVVFHTLNAFDTIFSADSVEWCPVEPFRNLIACGTYQLTENEEKDGTARSDETSRRVGRIYMFRVTNGGRLETLQQIDVPAVLDMKWMHAVANDDLKKILLAVVNAVGCLQIYRLTGDDRDTTLLELIAERRVSDEDDRVMALSLDWSTGRSVSNPRVVVSDSHGRVSRFTLRGGDIERDFSRRVHDYEAWIAAFDYWQTHSFYSGITTLQILSLSAK